jgi:hypothetical protein
MRPRDAAGLGHNLRVEDGRIERIDDLDLGRVECTTVPEGVGFRGFERVTIDLEQACVVLRVAKRLCSNPSQRSNVAGGNLLAEGCREQVTRLSVSDGAGEIRVIASQTLDETWDLLGWDGCDDRKGGLALKNRSGGDISDKAARASDIQ